MLEDERNIHARKNRTGVVSRTWNIDENIKKFCHGIVNATTFFKLQVNSSSFWNLCVFFCSYIDCHNVFGKINTFLIKIYTPKTLIFESIFFLLL